VRPLKNSNRATTRGLDPKDFRRPWFYGYTGDFPCEAVEIAGLLQTFLEKGGKAAFFKDYELRSQRIKKVGQNFHHRIVEVGVK
jgi:hypothetical protein